MSTPPPLPQHNPYAAPSARVEDIPSGELVLADRGTRLAAVIIDGMMFAAIGILAAVLIPALTAGNPEDNQALAVVVGLIMAVGMIGLLVVNLVLLHRYGQTLAKRWLKIKVVRSSGDRCELWRIIVLRWLPVTLLGAIPLIGYAVSLVDALMIFRADYRCLHDLFADTIVIRA